jgi:HPt (histidine-containing phosphotransfer) domain-containing protein
MKVNLDALRQISEDPGFLIEITDLFKEDIPIYLNEIKENEFAGDYNNVVAVLHKLKSAFGSIGITALHEEINVFEERWSLYTLTERREKLNEIIGKCQIQYEEARHQLDELLSSQ